MIAILLVLFGYLTSALTLDNMFTRYIVNSGQWDVIVQQSQSNKVWGLSHHMCSKSCLIEDCQAFMLNETQQGDICQLYWTKHDLSIPVLADAQSQNAIEIWSTKGCIVKEEIILVMEESWKTISIQPDTVLPLILPTDENYRLSQPHRSFVFKGHTSGSLYFCNDGTRKCKRGNITTPRSLWTDVAPMLYSTPYNSKFQMKFGSEVLVFGAQPAGQNWDPILGDYVQGYETIICNTSTGHWTTGTPSPYDLSATTGTTLNDRYGILFGGRGYFSRTGAHGSVVMLYDHLMKTFTTIYHFGYELSSAVCGKFVDQHGHTLGLCTAGLNIQTLQLQHFTYIFNVTSKTFGAKPEWDLPFEIYARSITVNGRFFLVGEAGLATLELKEEEWSDETNSFWHLGPAEMSTDGSITTISADYLSL